MSKFTSLILAVCLLLASSCSLISSKTPTAADMSDGPTVDDGSWFFLKTSDLPDLPADEHNTNHFSRFGKYVDGYNKFILEGSSSPHSSSYLNL